MVTKKEEAEVKNLVPVLVKQTAPIIKLLTSIEVIDEKSKGEAATKLNDLKAIQSRVVAYKEKKTKPLNALLKVIRDETRELEDNLKTAIDSTRAKLNDYQTEALRLARIEEDKIAARVGDGKGKLKPETAIKQIDALDKPAQSVDAGAGAVKFRTVKRLVITDLKEVQESIARQNRFDLFVINEAALKTAIIDGLVVMGAKVEEVQEAASYR